jgi:arsenate reductase
VITVLFACVHNAGRSQMAAAFFNTLADPMKARAGSAGTEPAARVHPLVLTAMEEIGIDVSRARPARLTHEMAATADLLVTMGCGDACPAVPGLKTEDWPLADPADRPLEEVRAVRDAVEQRVRNLIARENWGQKASVSSRSTGVRRGS